MRQAVVEQVWWLLAISFVDGHSVRYKIPGAFLHKGSSGLRLPQLTKHQANGEGDAYGELAIGKDLWTLGKDR